MISFMTVVKLNNMKKGKFTISGMSCGHCVKAVEEELAKLELKSLKVTVGSAEVEFDEERIGAEQLTAAITEAGFDVIDSELLSKE